MKSKIILLGLILMSQNLLAQSINVPKINNYIDSLQFYHQGIGSFYISKNGNRVINRDLGFDEIESQNNIYRIGSVTKLFTAVITFKLIEENKLDLETTLNNFFPEIPNSQNIKIRNLLEHTSGLQNYMLGKDGSLNWMNEKVTNEEIMKNIISQGIKFESGTDVLYSNSGYYILTKILEKITNQRYDQLLNRYIKTPYKLNILESYISHNSIVLNDSYFYNGSSWEVKNEFYLGNVIGVGDIVSTVEDLDNFIVKFFTYKILDKKYVDIMKPVIGKEQFGRGVMYIPFYDKHFLGHAGDTYGSHTVVGYNPEDKLAFTYIINGERYDKNKFAIDILSLIYNDSEIPDLKIRKIDNNTLDKYVGTYESDKLPLKIEIQNIKGELNAKATGQSSFFLKSESKTEFSYLNIRLKFNTENDIMLFKQANMEFEFRKIKKSL